MTNPTPADSNVGLIEKFDQLEDVLNFELVERRYEIGAAMLALVSGAPMFLLGPPGVAKSMLVNRLLAYIHGARGFEVLMTKFTGMEEVFGPTSLKGLKEDEFRRKIEGYLATAQIAFVDEIFKANSSILNAFLWAINERAYRHDTEVIPIPLHTLFCASNELPADESLNALYDRLLFRFEVSPIRDNRSFGQMLKTTIPKDPDPILTWDEIMTAHDESEKVTVPDTVIDAMIELRKQLGDAGIEPTERRFVRSMGIIRAAAFLDGCTQADLEHMRPLQHVLWEVPGQQSEVANLVLAIAAPLDKEANALLAEVEKLEEQLDGIGDSDEKLRKGQEIHGKLRRCNDALTELNVRVGTSRKRNETIAEVKARLHLVTERVLTEVFGVPKDEVPKGLVG